jgi:hypothetical protein
VIVHMDDNDLPLLHLGVLLDSLSVSSFVMGSG